MADRLAYYKHRPTQTLPHRPGPVQCVRNCTTCIIKHEAEKESEAEEFSAITSFDNLVCRRNLWFSKYQSIQYHPGQFALLKRCLNARSGSIVIFIVLTATSTDLDHLILALHHEKVPGAEKLDRSLPSLLELCEGKRPYILPMSMGNNDQQASMLDIVELRDMLNRIVDRALSNPVFDAHIVPVIISKDHNKNSFWEIGSICLQLLEPYPLQTYLKGVRSEFKTGHLIQHLYYDLARNAPILPSQMLAFILLNLDYNPKVQDIVRHMEWLRHDSMEFNLQIAFTGTSEKAVELGLLLLSEFISINRQEIIVKNFQAIAQYAQPMIPNFAHYGIISRAILMLHNRQENNEFLLSFNSSVRVRVMRDDVMKLSQSLAEHVDDKIPIRRPCATVETSILDSFSLMQTFGRYFKVEEPLIGRPKPGFSWAGDNDSDEEYFLSKRDDPAFKTWITITQKQEKLDKLNICLNSVQPYLLH